jgi:hypothetical protein
LQAGASFSVLEGHVEQHLVGVLAVPERDPVEAPDLRLGVGLVCCFMEDGQSLFGLTKEGHLADLLTCNFDFRSLEAPQFA